nr:hypothetical protein [Tanacetum cinerariifolium]
MDKSFDEDGLKVNENRVALKYSFIFSTGGYERGVNKLSQVGGDGINFYLEGVSYSYELRGHKRQAYECLENDEPRSSFSANKGPSPLRRSERGKIPTDGLATDLKLTKVVFPSAKDIVEFKPQLKIEPFASAIGHVRGLEYDEEGIFDVLFKLERSLDVLFFPCDDAAKERRKGNHVQVLFKKMKKIFRRGACNQLRMVWCLSWRCLFPKRLSKMG